MRVCHYGAPIILSWPHFLGAEHKYTAAVDGLNPEKVKNNILENIVHFTHVSLISQNTDSGLISKT